MMRNNWHKIDLEATEEPSPSDEYPDSPVSPGAASLIAEPSSLYTPGSMQSSTQACAGKAGLSTPRTDACAANVNSPTQGNLGKFSNEVEGSPMGDEHSHEKNGLTKTPACSIPNERNQFENQLPVTRSDLDAPHPTPNEDDDQLITQDAKSVPGQFLFHQRPGCLSINLLPTDGDVDLGTVISPDSSQVRNLLLDIALRYFDLHVNFVNQWHFHTHREMGIKSDHYSIFLENTLLACATRTSTSVAVRRLGKVYIERASRDIPSELLDPTLATLEGFFILADYEASQGHDRLGWTYIGELKKSPLSCIMHEN
jgi:hypothetical protein